MLNNNERLVEVARSFTYQLNTGNYQHVNFFCSQKIECLESEANEKSEALYQWVKSQVMKSVNDFKAGLNDPTLTLKKSVLENPIPTVNQWEDMTPEEQAFRQEVKKKDDRRDYAQRIADKQKSQIFNARDIK